MSELRRAIYYEAAALIEKRLVKTMGQPPLNREHHDAIRFALDTAMALLREEGQRQ